MWVVQEKLEGFGGWRVWGVGLEGEAPEADVVPLAQLVADGGEGSDGFEAHAPVEVDAGGVGQGDAGVGVEVAEDAESFQEGRVEGRGDAAASEVFGHVYGDFDGPAVAGSGSEGGGVGVAGDAVAAFAYEPGEALEGICDSMAEGFFGGGIGFEGYGGVADDGGVDVEHPWGVVRVGEADYEGGWDVSPPSSAFAGAERRWVPAFAGTRGCGGKEGLDSGFRRNDGCGSKE